MSSISAAAITDAGYAALVNALATGGKIFPQTARVSATVHQIDRELSALTDYWWEGEITLVSVIDENTYEARVVIPPDQAQDYMRAVALYLDDGTLFAVSAAKDLPPGAGQELIIQLTYLDIVALTDFQYLAWEDWENQLEIMDKFSQLGNSILENAEAIGLLEDRISDLPGYTQEMNDLENGVSGNTQAINALTGQVSENTSDIGSLDGRVSQNETDISSLNTQVAGSDSDISSLNSQVSTNTGNISSLTGRVDQNETDITSLNSQMAGNDSDISSLNSQVSTNTGNISSLDGRVGQNETDITSLNSQVAGNDSDISSLNSQVTQNTSNISTLDGRVTGNDQNIIDLQDATTPTVTIGGQQILLGLRKVIDQDITLTCTAASTGADFCGDDALPQALAALDSYDITGNVTIQLADGVYGAGTPLQTIELNHKDIDRISIVGNVGNTAALTYIGGHNESVCDLSNMGGVYSASDFTPGGNYQPFIFGIVNSGMKDGVYKATAAYDNGTNIVVTVTPHIDAYNNPYGTVYLMPSNRCQLIFAANQNGFKRHYLPGKASIQGVSLRGSTSGEAFSVQGSGVLMQLKNVTVSGFSYGVVAKKQAYVELLSSGYTDSAYIHGSTYGFWASQGGYLQVNSAFSGVADIAFYATENGTLLADGCIASNCVPGYGYQEDNSFIQARQSMSMNNRYPYTSNGGRIDQSESVIYYSD